MTEVTGMNAAPDGQVPPSEDGGAPVLRTEGIAKTFGAVVALRRIDLELRRGEVLGLVGDNGAGKSTFVKILTGFHRPDTGRIFLDGKEVRFRSVKEARAHGIETVYQDLALIPQLPVYLNLFLNREHTSLANIRWLSKQKMRRLARQYLDEIKVSIPNIDAEVESLSGGQRQAIAVARATQQQAKILLLDEPLAAMGAKESAMIIDLVKDLSRNRKETMIIIDHNHTHLFELCDRLAVIQHGTITFDKPVKDTSIEELTDLMVSSYRAQIVAGQRERRAS
ncbi:MAG TPA: ATP-binding cassette domain-containing protein [Acidimicrobiales bacterium]|nr:ATP-binding cassette domain-containing protein [Acidimicrobiales bacterium]